MYKDFPYEATNESRICCAVTSCIGMPPLVCSHTGEGNDNEHTSTSGHAGMHTHTHTHTYNTITQLCIHIRHLPLSVKDEMTS